MILVEYKCKLLSLKDWSALLGLPYDTLRMRYNRGMRGSRLFSPVGQAR
jgi:hypothetical protein